MLNQVCLRYYIIDWHIIYDKIILETEGPAPLKSALKKTASGQSANGAKQSGVVKKVRFAGSVCVFIKP